MGFPRELFITVKIEGRRFKDPQRLRLASRHASAGPPHNERLEHLGGAALDLVVAEELYQ